MAWYKAKRRPKYSKYSGSTARRAAGNMRAAAAMRDKAQVTVQGITQVPITVPYIAGTANGGNAVGLSIWQLAMQSAFFNNYANMYDQIKLNGFRMKFIGSSAGSVTLSSGLSSIDTVVAYDRNGIKGEPVWLTVLPTAAAGTYYSSTVMETGMVAPQRAAKVFTYGSVKTKPWSPGNAYTQYLHGYAQVMKEKADWTSLDKLSRTFVKKADAASLTGSTMHVGYPSGVANPSACNWVNIVGAEIAKTFIIDKSSSDLTDKEWDPVAYIGVYNVPYPTNHTDQVFTFTVEYKIDLSFRGTRAGMAPALADNVQTVTGNEQVTTLETRVNAGERLDLQAPEGYLWNEAIIQGEDVEATLLDQRITTNGRHFFRPDDGTYFSGALIEVEAGIDEYRSTWGLSTPTALTTETNAGMQRFFEAITGDGQTRAEKATSWNTWVDANVTSTDAKTWYKGAVQTWAEDGEELEDYPTWTDVTAFIRTLTGDRVVTDNIPPPPPGSYYKKISAIVNGQAYVLFISTNAIPIVAGTSTFEAGVDFLQGYDYIKKIMVSPQVSNINYTVTENNTYKLEEFVRQENRTGLYNGTITVDVPIPNAKAYTKTLSLPTDKTQIVYDFRNEGAFASKLTLNIQDNTVKLAQYNQLGYVVAGTNRQVDKKALVATNFRKGSGEDVNMVQYQVYCVFKQPELNPSADSATFYTVDFSWTNSETATLFIDKDDYYTTFQIREINAKYVGLLCTTNGGVDDLVADMYPTFGRTAYFTTSVFWKKIPFKFSSV